MTIDHVIPTALLAFSLLATESAARGDEPTDARGFLARGHAWFSKADWEKAGKDYSEAIRLGPDDPRGYYYRGSVRLKTRQWKAAIEDFSEAVRLDPKHTWAYYGRGKAWHSSGEQDKAIADATEVIRLDPKNSLAFTLRAAARLAKREYDKADEDLTEAIRFDSKNASAFGARGVVRRAKLDFEESTKDFDEAIRLDSKNAYAYANRALNYAAWPDEKRRDTKKAMEDAKKACELTEWKSPYPLEAYAAACAESGDFAEAVKWQKKALEDKAHVKSRGTILKECLELYEAKKPFRYKVIPPASCQGPLRNLTPADASH